MNRLGGKVKWFNEKKGYGFINAAGVNDDIFVHYSGINGEGFKTLKTGDVVEFTLNTGSKGKYATDVEVVDEEDAHGRKSKIISIL